MMSDINSTKYHTIPRTMVAIESLPSISTSCVRRKPQVHNKPSCVQVLGQPVGVGRARVGLYQPSDSLYATVKRRSCDSPSTELERTRREKTIACFVTLIRTRRRSWHRVSNVLRARSQGRPYISRLVVAGIEDEDAVLSDRRQHFNDSRIVG